jgi:hypothetical protein
MEIPTEGKITAREVFKNRAGIYSCKTCHPEFASMVLVTVANFDYLDMLQNWECRATRLGLDWAVVSLDNMLYRHYKDLKPFRVVHSGGNYSGKTQFRQKLFNQISCAKIRIVLDIMIDTGLDVVFSDPDNVFNTDPFKPGVSFGDMVRSREYGYVFQPNVMAAGNNRYSVVNKDGQFHGIQLDASCGSYDEGNTGFYYVASSLQDKARGLRDLFEGTLQACTEKPGIDDQTHFWSILRALHHGDRRNRTNAFQCARSCGEPDCPGKSSDTLSYCCARPIEFPTGWSRNALKAHGNQFVTYHANFVSGKKGKISKLDREAGLWNPECK